MQCLGCHLQRDLFYCERCVRNGFTSHANATSVLNTQLSLSRTRCERILSGTVSHNEDVAAVIRSKARRRGLNAERILRAEVAALDSRNAKIGGEVQEREAAVTTRVAALRDRRADVQRRRTALREARLQQGLEAEDIRTELGTLRRQTDEAHASLGVARKILVNEVVHVFDVKRSGPPCKAHQKSADPSERFSIAGLDMPAPRRFSAHSSTHVNGTLQHLVHLLTLTTGYLGIALPFKVHWAEEGHLKDGEGVSFVGKIYLDAADSLPFIRAASAPARIRPGQPETSDSSTSAAPHSLLLSKPKMLYVSTGREKWRKAEADKHKPRGDAAASAVLVNRRNTSAMEDSAARDRSEEQDTKKDRRARKEEQLVDGYSMLIVDVSYLATTQGVETGIAPDHPLAMLLALTASDDLGRASHIAGADHLTSIRLDMDIASIHDHLQSEFAMLVPLSDAKRAVYKRSVAKADELLDEWDLV